MDCLAWIHGRLGATADAADWRRQADQLMERMLGRLWNGSRFVTIRADDGAANPDSRSWLRFAPLVLGDRLPEAIRRTVIADLRAHLGPIGIASEDVDGPLHLANSYWRGPVWSPPTVLVSEGLRDAGETALADEIARRYCANCARHGFWENYDPHDGHGLCDSGLPWTAAPFLTLAARLGTQTVSGS
jgi:glycogen debranching enzyme